jgi:hypothetical protein
MITHPIEMGVINNTGNTKMATIKENKTKEKKKAQIEIPDREAALVDRKFWTVRVQPDTLTVLGSNIVSGTMVLKNYGSGTIRINNGTRETIELELGVPRIISVYHQVELFTTDEKSALVEFEFLPGLK